ncbi:hypothetical protein N7495_000689 [Penicillium taxi]|uniref:uncharacterized protein n=1 Tax=Penicillium taxi TaxID=168475 RepID=UPI00254591CE|nr:uncharacterized protein N7495_000689 [Penicillium taxi]KAJ5908007.1 hypothetical protein N7495_000689 [Penicillium taxi]
MMSNLKLWKSWKSASSDIISLAWSPNGTQFAAGATAPSDAYNRKNNFLVGDLVHNTLYEIPDHWVPPESSASMDERIYTSVTAAQWVGDRLFSASYDSTVKIWDVGLGQNEKNRPACIQTLKHASSVLVMALPKGNPNILATGAEGFRLWSLPEGENPTEQYLPIHRMARQKSGIDLEPTNLAWGEIKSTSNVLVGGMAAKISDDYKVSERGHLEMWRVCESDVTSHKLVPDSQNVFDIKWHPSLPRFATAIAANPQMVLPRGSHSVVNVYDYNPGEDKRPMKLACPARDINELTFCPMSSNYVTASCTDGATYVWDIRYHTKTVHKLQHGCPLHPIDPAYPREITDFGVTLAQWGASIDQFYTGSSDGYLKQWDIRQAPENALIANQASIEQGISSGVFSQDKTQLLIGDHGGGLWVFSSMFNLNAQDTNKKSGRKPTQFNFKSAAMTTSSESEMAGIEASRELIASGELFVHPIFGAGQAKNYKGPYAPWARKPNTPLAQLAKTPLLPEYEVRQFHGLAWPDRPGIDTTIQSELENNLAIAMARNHRPSALAPIPSTEVESVLTTGYIPSVKRKRKRAISDCGKEINTPKEFIDIPDQKVHPLIVQTPEKVKSKQKHFNREGKKKKVPSEAPGIGIIVYNDREVIDLTGDSPEPTLETREEREKRVKRLKREAKEAKAQHKEERKEKRRKRKLEKESLLEKECPISHDEEDHWWPPNGTYDANIYNSD